MSKVINLGKKSIKLRFDEPCIDSSILGVVGDINSRTFDVELYDEDGWILDSEVNIKLLMTTESEPTKVLYANGTRLDSGKYRIVIPSEVFTRKQAVECQFKVELNGSTILTPVFKRMVDRSLIGVEVEGKSLYLDVDKMADFITNYESKKSDITSLFESKVSSAKEEINSYVNSEKSELNSHTVTKIEEFNSNANSKFGGYLKENLISGTTNEWVVYEKKDGVDTINEAIHYLGELDIRPLSVGDKFTFSFKYAFENLEFGSGASIYLQAPGNKLGFNQMTGTYPINIDLRNKEGFYSQTIDVTSNLKRNDKYGPIYLRIDHAIRGKIKIKELKAEKGDTATPWCYSIDEIVKMKNRAYSGTNENLLDGSSKEWKEIVINDTKPAKVSYIPKLGRLMGYNLEHEQTYTASCVLELENLILDGTPKLIIEAPSKQNGWDKPVFSNYISTKMTNGTLKISEKLNHPHSEIEYNPFNLRIENVQSGTIRLKELKIERGEAATPWKLSTNDYIDLEKRVKTLENTVAELVKKAGK